MNFIKKIIKPKQIINFAAGPTQLNKSVKKQAAKALVNYNNSGRSICEITHFEDEWKNIYNKTIDITNNNWQVFHDGNLVGSFSNPTNQISSIDYYPISGDEFYIDNMIKWANECKRVLKNEGTLFLNIGDKYGKKSQYIIHKIIAELFIKAKMLKIWQKEYYICLIKKMITNNYLKMLLRQ